MAISLSSRLKDDEMLIKQPNRYAKSVPSPDFPWEGIVGRETTKPLCTNGFRVKCTVSRPQISHPTLTGCLYRIYTCPSLPSIIERQSGETALSYKRERISKSSGYECCEEGLYKFDTNTTMLGCNQVRVRKEI